jgi:hypothetical protein
VGGRNCGYVDTLFPHPYLGFVHHGNPPCGINVNNIGLFDADFPSARRTDRFVILLTGGSVANQFVRPQRGDSPYFEQLLNKRFVSPNGKPFLVLNGADGAWKQPQQAIIFLLYADAVDAVVTLDGFNEHYMIGAGYRFEYPANNFNIVNPLASRNFGDVVAQWAVGSVREAAARNAILSRSQAAYTLISAAQDYLAKRAESRPKPKTTIDSLFLLPQDWSPEQRSAWALDQYKKYIRAMNSVARTEHVRSAFFLQPAPAVAKQLTDEERRVVGDLKYAAVYQDMAKQLLSLDNEGIPVVSLLEIFDHNTSTLYADPIHLRREKDGTSPGYELMAQEMANHLGQLWMLNKR